MKKTVITLSVVILALIPTRGARADILAITPVCDDKIMTPLQNGNYPPEGYHCRPVPEGMNREHEQDNNPSTVPAIIPEPTESPVVPVVTVKPPEPTPEPTKPQKPDKPHCDNGEGNGGEGCSPSDNGNNDED